MIVKKVRGSKVKNKAASIRDLADYIRLNKKQNIDEKVMYTNGRGFISDSPAGQREEMAALAAEAVRSKNPVNHYVVSWRELEKPSLEQIEEAVTIFMEELGLKDHQVIYSLHQDTDNLHLHILLNRVHPETLKCVEINRGFDIEAAHRAIALIEYAQGWQPQQNGRYQVLENGELGRESIDPDKPKQPEQRKRDMENRTGEKSAERIAIENGAPIIKQAQSWEQLHGDLAKEGMRYERKGSGAILWINDIAIKASSADREASLSKLEKRFGVYQPSIPQPVVPRKMEPIKPDVPGWNDYIAGRKAHYTKKKSAKLEQDKTQAQERKALAKRQKVRRDELLKGQWKGKGDFLNAMRSIIAEEQASEKAALKEKHRQERAQWRQQFRPYPDLEEWYRMQGKPELAEQWRYRASEPVQSETESKQAAVKSKQRQQTKLKKGWDYDSSI